MAHTFTVTAADSDRRLDRWLQRVLGDVPPSLVQRLLRQKKLRVNSKRVRDGSYRLQAGDEVVVHHHVESAPSTDEPVREQRQFEGDVPEVLHRDDDYLVISKPAGVACSDDGQDARALSLWLREYLAAEILDGSMRPEPCHRLDRETTGIVVVALTANAFDRFRRALEAGEVTKRYEVAVWGEPRFEELDYELPLWRRPSAQGNEPRVIEPEVSTPADQIWASRTRFRVLERGYDCTLLAAEPVTGRTHQIRAHCLTLDLPVVGDRRYGAPERDAAAGIRLTHQFLHSSGLSMGALDVNCPWPADALAQLRSLGLAE